MYELCKRFQNSILLILEFAHYLGSALILFSMLGVENRQVRVLSRTSVVMAIMYLLVFFVMLHVYGSFDLRERSPRAVKLHLGLSIFFTDMAVYLVLLVMNTSDANNRVFALVSPLYFMGAVVLQLLWNQLIVSLSASFYFWITPPKACLVVLSSMDEQENVRRVIEDFEGYRVDGVILYDDGKIYESMRKYDSVFFYDVPPGARSVLVDYCYKHLIPVYLNPEISDIVEMSSHQMMFGDVPFLARTFSGMTFEQRVVKRLADIFIPICMLIILSPLLAVSAAAVHFYDGGPVFFRQKRATLRGRVFEIYKFRTMRTDAGNRSAGENDDRITAPGRFLRRFRIDELPQLINIIKGDMSLVGPRPEMIENVMEYESDMPEFHYRLRMKAGLTGYAQVMGRYNTSSRDKLILDLMYIENFSLLLDARLLFMTVLVFFNSEDSTEGFRRESGEEKDWKDGKSLKAGEAGEDGKDLRDGGAGEDGEGPEGRRGR